MFKVLALAVFISAVPVFADDAGMVADAGSVVVVESGTPVVSPLKTTVDPAAGTDLGWFVIAAKEIKSTVVNKDWGRMVFLIITALVVFCRKVLAPKIPFFSGKLGAPILAFFWAGAAALGTTWPAGEKLQMSDLWLALQAGIMAAGGWSLLKNTLEHFYPKTEGQKNWATVVAGWVGALQPLLEKPKDPPPPAPPAPAPGA